MKHLRILAFLPIFAAMLPAAPILDTVAGHVLGRLARRP